MRNAIEHRVGGLPPAVRFLVAPMGAFVLLQLLFFALLVGGAAVPDEKIVDNLAADVKSGMYGPTGLRDRMGGRSDSFTECVVVGVGLGGNETNPVRKAGIMPRISNCKLGATQIADLAQGKSVQDGYYFRYWSGFTPLTRPVLAKYGITGARLVSGALLALALVVAASAISRLVGAVASLGLLGPLIISTNVMSTPSTSFSQALSIATYLFGVALCAWGARRSVAWGVVGSALAAAVFCYVDLLTTPAIGWALSAASVAGVTYVRTKALRPALIGVLATGLVWPVVFGATWVSRWVLAIPFLGWDPVLADVKTAIFFRTEGEYTGVRNELGAASGKNWSYWIEYMETAQTVVALAIVVAVAGLFLAARRGLNAIGAVGVIALPAACIPFWYEVVRNHSQIHAFFTYRGVPVAIGVVLFAVVVGARVGWAEPDDDDTAQDPLAAQPALPPRS